PILPHTFPTRRSSDLLIKIRMPAAAPLVKTAIASEFESLEPRSAPVLGRSDVREAQSWGNVGDRRFVERRCARGRAHSVLVRLRSEEHTSELQSPDHL